MIYIFKNLYVVSQILMTIDLLPIKHQMATILDLFFNETLKLVLASEINSALKITWKRDVTLKYM